MRNAANLWLSEQINEIGLIGIQVLIAARSSTTAKDCEDNVLAFTGFKLGKDSIYRVMRTLRKMKLIRYAEDTEWPNGRSRTFAITPRGEELLAELGRWLEN